MRVAQAQVGLYLPLRKAARVRPFFMWVKRGCSPLKAALRLLELPWLRHFCFCKAGAKVEVIFFRPHSLPVTGIRATPPEDQKYYAVVLH